MKVIHKKIRPEYFKEVEAGRKNFELRKDENAVNVGDVLILHEIDPETEIFTESIPLVKNVKYVLRNVPEYGLKEGYCIIGF